MVHATGRASWRRAGALAAVLLSVGLLAGACGTSSDSDQGQSGGDGGSSGDTTPSTLEPDAGTPKDGGKLAYALVAETSGWNPASGQWAASGHQVAMAIYDRLGAWDANYQVQPYLAESITPNSDFTEWTLGVREGVTFHNGDPVDAEAIATNLTQFQNAALTKSALAPIETVTPSADGKTVSVKMKKSFSTYPLQLTSQVGVVAWPGMYDTAANPDATRNPVGSGPFKFESWEQNAKLNVVKNADYWREGLPHLDEIEFSIVTDNQARQAALKTGTVDIAEFFDIESITEFRNTTTEDEFRMLADPNGEADEALIMLNTEKPPFDNPKAREALAKGINRDEILTVVGDGALEPATGPFQPNSPWYSETNYPTYDPDGAKKLVEEVKAEGDGTFAFTLTGVPVVETQRMVQLLQQQWEPLGIDITLEDTEQTTLINRAVTADYQAVTWRQFGATIPDGEYVWTTCENIAPPGSLSLNFARNCDEELDAAMDKARTTLDQDVQKQQYKIFQERLAADIPYIWLYETQAVVIASTKVHDITKSTLPDGQPALGMVSVVHGLAQVWIST
jgi:ABC-type transport system substrate-binding protein